MGAETGISWTNRTFNVLWGCEKVSPACTNCYAETLAKRFDFDVWGKTKPRRVFPEKHWNEPLQYEKAAVKAGVQHLVFCSSMCDVFEDHPTVIAETKKLWPLIRATPHLTWQLLTKRPERILANLPADWGGGYPNVWIGATIENNDYIHRADHLRSVPAVVRFVSYEPACGPIDKLDMTGLHWLIFGGESGPGFREVKPEWPRDARDRCAEKGVVFFYKQGSSFKSGADCTLDGVEHKAFPADHVFAPLPEKKKRNKINLPVIE